MVKTSQFTTKYNSDSHSSKTPKIKIIVQL